MTVGEAFGIKMPNSARFARNRQDLPRLALVGIFCRCSAFDAERSNDSAIRRQVRVRRAV